MIDVVFFLGAGFTKGATGTAPVGEELARAVLGRICRYAPDIGHGMNPARGFVSRFFGVQMTDSPPSVVPRLEDVLTLADWSWMHKQNLAPDYGYKEARIARNALLRAVVNELAETLRAQSHECCNQFFGRLAEGGASYAIVSTNYDLVVDNQLMRLGSCNYGVRARRNLSIEDVREDYYRRGGVRGGASDLRWHSGSQSGYVNQGAVMNLKLHGSLNWLYCPRCQELDVTMGEKSTQLLTDHGSSLLCANSACTCDYEPLLILPTMYKQYENRVFEETWALAGMTLEQAHKVVFIGYSLPEADYELKCLIAKSIMGRREHDRFCLVVVDDDIAQPREGESKQKFTDRKKQVEATGERYRAFFGHRLSSGAFMPIGLKGLVERYDEIVLGPPLPQAAE
jgi:hypothetical protein